MKAQRLDARPARPLVGDSPAMAEVRRLIAAWSDAAGPLLIRGESGVGKEVAACALHQGGVRAEGALWKLPCAGTQPRELARLLEPAAGTPGDLILDEIGDLPPQGQELLLAWLRGGGEATVRVLALTMQSLEDLAAAGGFSSDLLDLLSRRVMEIPPLRLRRQDVPLLIEHLLALEARRRGRPAPAVGPATQALLEAHPWPGNVRELANALAFALMLAGGGPLEPDHLPPGLRRRRALQPASRLVRRSGTTPEM